MLGSGEDSIVRIQAIFFEEFFSVDLHVQQGIAHAEQRVTLTRHCSGS